MKILDGVLMGLEENEKKMSKIVIPTEVTSIGASAFRDCNRLTSVIIPESVKSIGYYAFADCALTNIVIPKSVTSIGKGTFENCSWLTSVVIPKSVTSIGNRAFADCINLTSLTIPKSVTSIGAFAFSECRRLTRVTIPKSVTSIGYGAFNDCYRLTSVKIPKSVTSIGECAFADCINLTSLTIPDCLTSIDDSAFSGCSNLTSVKIPKSVTSIGECAFADCINLTSLTIPDCLTSIGYGVFSGCSSLTSVTIPESVTSIDDSAFRGCSNLTNIICYPVINLVQQVFGNEIDKLSNSLSKIFLFDGYPLDKIKLILEKYKAIYYNIRFYPNIKVVEKISLDQAKKFKLEIWKTLATHPLFSKNDETKSALVEFIAITGLFESDYQTRLNYITNIFLNYNINTFIFDNDYCSFYDGLSGLDKKLFDSCYQEAFGSIFKLKNDINENDIEENYKDIYMVGIKPRLEKGYLTEREYRELKEINSLYKNFLNKYFIEHIISVHKIKINIGEVEKQKINRILFERDIDNLLTYNSIHRMFDGCKQVYNPDCYVFIMKNIEVILSTPSNQSMLSAVVNGFSEINNYYSNNGNKNFDYYTALMYLKTHKFVNVIEDNEEFSDAVSRAGVTEQDKFELYQDINETTRKRIESAIPRYDNIFTININGREYKIRCKILHQKSYMNSLIGEIEYTNCCQCAEREGQKCMEHASTSSYGGIFATYLINENEIEEMLTESWVWVRNGLLCFDDIEATLGLRGSNDTERQRNRRLALYGYKMSSKGLIEASKEQIETYIKKHPKLSEEEIKNLRSGRIRKVTVGNTQYNRVDISSIIEGDETRTLQPLNYNGYSDSKRQCVIEGIDEVIDINTPTPIIYRDDRQVVRKFGDGISGEILRRIKEMEKEIYPESMQVYNNIFNELDEEAEDLTALVGEDWYIVYAEDDKSIRIHDMAKTTPRFDDESSVQSSELSSAYKSLIENSNGKTIEADLRESTSYVLYLFYLSHGIIEQIGDDYEFEFCNQNNMQSIDSIKQNEILKNRNIRRDNIMHRVKFKYKQNNMGRNSIRM